MLHGEETPWWRMVWFSGHVPRFSFICWLICHGRLATRDRLAQWGVVQDTGCLLCDDGTESRDHLFFDCPYSSEIWRTILLRCHLVHDPGPWTEEIVWFSQHCISAGFASTLRKISFTATVYHLWRERNLRAFQHEQRPSHSLIHSILSDVRCRLSHLGTDVDDLPIHSALADTWGILLTFRRPTFTWVRWTPPEEGWIAIHTDASLRDDMAGLGCCLRDPRGEFIAGSAWGEPRGASILFHELQAIYRGMELAWFTSASHIHVWSDSHTAIDIIQGLCAAPWQTWHICSDIDRMKERFTCALFHFVPREGNRAADFLTHHCDHIGEIRLSPHGLPAEFYRILEADASGSYFCRYR